MALGLRRQIALIGMPTTHGALIAGPGSPTVSGPGGRGLVLVGPTLIAPHVLPGPEFHAPNPVQAGSGTQVVKVDNFSVAFVGDSFN